MKPYYERDGIVIYHGDVFDVLADVEIAASVVVTDPPFGIDYESGHAGRLARHIAGDKDVAVRDMALECLKLPALVFGSWKAPRPDDTRMVLIWDTLGANGMGALDLPWKPSHQEIYVIGSGFTGYRGSDVIQCAPVQSMACNGRVHPHEKPVALLKLLIEKCPPGTVLDPFCGAGSTLLAARELGRKAIGIELVEAYCEIAAKRLDQQLLPFEAAQ